MLSVASSSIPDLIGTYNHRQSRLTVEFARFLFEMLASNRALDPIRREKLQGIRARIYRCSQDSARSRCDSSLCPKCACRRSRKEVAKLEGALLGLLAKGDAKHGFALLTLTVASPSPAQGVATLKGAISTFVRRTPVLAAIHGGAGLIREDPAAGSEGERWNVHLHAIVVLANAYKRVDRPDLNRIWCEVLQGAGYHGSCDLRQNSNLSAVGFRKAWPDDRKRALIYALKREPAKWMKDSHEVFAERFAYHTTRPRLASTWGVLHGRTRKGRKPIPRPCQVGKA